MEIVVREREGGWRREAEGGDAEALVCARRPTSGAITVHGRLGGSGSVGEGASGFTHGKVDISERS